MEINKETYMIQSLLNENSQLKAEILSLQFEREALSQQILALQEENEQSKEDVNKKEPIKRANKKLKESN